MIHTWGNIVEGTVWIVIAGVILARAHRQREADTSVRTDRPAGNDSSATAEQARRTRTLAHCAAASFVLFGISDFVEVGTGAWYRPIGLLAWKGACLITLVWCLIRYRRLAQTNSESHRDCPG